MKTADRKESYDDISLPFVLRLRVRPAPLGYNMNRFGISGITLY